jgi:hypothetical protein
VQHLGALALMVSDTTIFAPPAGQPAAVARLAAAARIEHRPVEDHAAGVHRSHGGGGLAQVRVIAVDRLGHGRFSVIIRQPRHTTSPGRKHHDILLVIRALLLAVAVAAAPLAAKTLRWSSQGDILTMDPHSQNEGLNNSWADHVYETLVTRDKQLKVERCLAVSWEQVSPTVARFKLRPNVKFHDGLALHRRRRGVQHPARQHGNLALRPTSRA